MIMDGRAAEQYDPDQDPRGSRGLSMANSLYGRVSQPQQVRVSVDYVVFERLLKENPRAKPGQHCPIQILRDILVGSGYTHLWIPKQQRPRTQVPTSEADSTLVRAAFGRVYSGYVARVRERNARQYPD